MNKCCQETFIKAFREVLILIEQRPGITILKLISTLEYSINLLGKNNELHNSDSKAEG